jgi:hypothetical protein
MAVASANGNDQVAARPGHAGDHPVATAGHGGSPHFEIEALCAVTFDSIRFWVLLSTVFLSASG